MTTIVEAKQIILAEFETEWALAHPTVPFFFESESRGPPVGGPYVHLYVRHFLRAQESLGAVGGRKFQSNGNIVLQIFAPLDGGSAVADNLALSAQSILEAKTFTSGDARVHTTSATVNELGPTDDGYQTNVSTAFNYHQTK